MRSIYEIALRVSTFRGQNPGVFCIFIGVSRHCCLLASVEEIA